MRENRFNFLEYSINKDTKSYAIVVAKLKNKILTFEGKTAFLDFLEIASKTSRNNLHFFITDPTFLLNETLLLDKQEHGWEVEYFLVKSYIYKLSLKRCKKKIIINNIIHLVPNFSLYPQNSDYVYFPYWTSPLYHSQPKYTLPSDKKSWAQLDEMREKFLQDWLSSQNEAAILIDEHSHDQSLNKASVISLLKKNINVLESVIKTVDRGLSPEIRNWAHYPSASSLSLKIFDSGFNTHKVNLNGGYDEDVIFRPSFFGGRCEVFGNALESEQVVHFDFPNMYGNIMKENFPTGNLIKVENNFCLQKPGFFFVKATSDRNIPILPHRKVNQTYGTSSTIYSNGTFEGLYTNFELLFFLENGGKLEKIYWGYSFDGEMLPIFKTFVEYIIGLRSGDETLLWKSILVSFFGRMGMKPIVDESFIVRKEDYYNFAAKNSNTEERWLGKKACLLTIKREDPIIKSRVLYSAIITSLARIKLYRAFQAVESNGGRVLYCDTDSIFAAYPKSQIILNEKHGDIYWDEKNPKTKILSSVFASTRSYSIKYSNTWETKITGIPRNSIPFDSFKQEFYASWSRPFQIDTYGWDLKNHSEWAISKSIYISNYDKRVFDLNKKQTKPWYKINEDYVS